MAKKVVKVAAAAVSKTVFIENPKFDVDTSVPQEPYNSKIGIKRWMIALKPGQKLTPDMEKCVTRRDGRVYVHVNLYKNESGKVQFGRLGQSESYGFFNVAATESEKLNSREADIKQKLDNKEITAEEAEVELQWIKRSVKLDQQLKDGKISQAFHDKMYEKYYEEYIEAL